MPLLNTELERDSPVAAPPGVWFNLRHSRLVDNVVALYVLQFANYLLPLITVPYIVRVLTPSGYGLGAFALSFAGLFGTIADYGFNLTGSRAISVHRRDPKEVSRIVTQVVVTKSVMLGCCAAIFCLLVWIVPKLQGNSVVMWMAYLQVAGTSFTPIWLYQGLEELRFSSRVTLAVRVAYVPALFLFLHCSTDVWKWMVLQAAVALISGGILWTHACRHLAVGFTRPRWHDLLLQVREGFTLFISQAAVKAYSGGNTFILGMFTNVTMAGYYNAAERVVQTVLGLLGPIMQAVYPRASQLAVSSREAALRFMRKMLVLMGSVGFGMSAGILVGAPWLVPILLGPRFLPSVTIMQILGPLPFLIALSNVLGTQIMVPFKHDLPFMVILVCAGMFNLGIASLLAPHWYGNGMAFSVTCSELLVTISMFWYLGRQRLSPLIRVELEVVSL